MVFQKPTPVPDVDLRQHRLRRPALREAARERSSTTASRRPCARRRCGTRSRTSCASPAWASPAASSSACASRAPSRSSPEVILFDEPTSALDPISTGKIEELIEQLRDEFTIVIVTHNMQQAARISQFTAFMYLGELVEFGPTTRDLHEPGQEADAGLHHRPLRLIARSERRPTHGGTHRQLLRLRAAGSAPRASPRWAASPRRCSSIRSRRSCAATRRWPRR